MRIPSIPIAVFALVVSLKFISKEVFFVLAFSKFFLRNSDLISLILAFFSYFQSFWCSHK